MAYFIEEAINDFADTLDAKKYGRLDTERALRNIRMDTVDMMAEKGLNDDLRNPAVQQCLSNSIDSCVMGYVKNKQTLCQLYSDFAAYLKDREGIDIAVPVLVNYQKDPLSIQLEIVKALHGNKLTTKDLSIRLDISEQSIRKYLREMSSASPTEGLFIQGEKIQIEFNDVNHKYSILDTVHPLFLTASVRQVWAVLEGLYMVEQGNHKQYAFDMACNIWAQLSDYCKNKIKAMRLSPEIREQWVNRMEVSTKPSMFQTEREVYEKLSRKGIADIDYFFKSGNGCYVEVRVNNEPMMIKCSKVLSHAFNGTKYRIKDENGEEHDILVSDILSTRSL